eukprot:TRINITY_DN31277_c0_g1_i1.p1 TRINITY_DN31277_c0_g1~~TRINITY_DN31277_c0_g1_i1.p1  ORF type:complete len:902 (-),score=173.08 TRINITY_DN31277_c0_g1_i1:106-2811(-)
MPFTAVDEATPLDLERGGGYGAALQVSPELFETGEAGLSSAEAAVRLERFGPNELPKKQDNKLLKFVMEFLQPMPLIIWAAIGIELLEWHYGGSSAAILDAGVLLVLQVLNVVIGFFEELKANQEVEALRASLKPAAVVVRDGSSRSLAACEVVPGDRLILASGAAVPADCVVCEGQRPVQVDQAAITGESLPVTMHPGSSIVMGSTITHGECQATVHSTGASTMLGKTAALINTVDEQSNFEKVLRSLLVSLVVLGIIVCTLICIYLRHQGMKTLEVLSFTAVLLIASIPVALRVVCTCTLALGCKELAAEKAIVARLSSIEEFAGMDILCSDKTGTLTLNKMELQDDIPTFDKASPREVLRYAALAGKWLEPPKDALDTLVFGAVDCKALTDMGFVQTDYIPFDHTLKRTESVVKTPEGKSIKFMKGAPDVVLELCKGNVQQVRNSVEKKVLDFAKRGIRCLGVAQAEEGGEYCFQGILTFLDPPRPDTHATLKKADALGVSVKMITGDHLAIAQEMASTLGLSGDIEGPETLPNLSIEEVSKGGTELGQTYGPRFEKGAGFAQVLPEHKYLIVEALRQHGHLVGMNGDGVNDAPALKRADVGIAVQGATDAAQAASDIVLTRPGLSTIVTCIFTSRRIFQRMKNFVIYRVACTVQLLLFFFLSCLLFNPSKLNHNFEANFFTIPVIALVSITILNDGTIVAVAYDNVDAGSKPAKWNLCSLYIVSMSIGVSALAGSIILLQIALTCDNPGSIWHQLGLPTLDYGQVMTVMFLKISLSDYVSVFNSRCRGWMWSRAPSSIVLLSATFAMLVTTAFSYKVPFPGMGSLDIHTISFVWIYILVWAIIQDICKMATYAFLGKIGWCEDELSISEEDLVRAETKPWVGDDIKGEFQFKRKCSI